MNETAATVWTSNNTYPAQPWPADDWETYRKYAVQYPYSTPCQKRTPEDIQKQIEALQKQALVLKRDEAARHLVSGLNSDQLAALLNDTKRMAMLKQYLEQLFMAHEIETAL